MSQARRMAMLLLLGVAILVLSILILIRNRSTDLDILAVIGILGGLAVVVVVLPTNGHDKDK
jgi:hypothetical protein